MADGDEYEHIDHTFQINDHQYGNVYTATSPIFPPYGGPNTLAMGMNYTESRHHYSYTNTSSGVGGSATNFPFYHQHFDAPTKVNSVIAVGPLIGEPLLDWLRREMCNGNAWHYNSQGGLIGLRNRGKKLFHLLGVALAPIHERGGYVGDIIGLARVNSDVNSDITNITFDNFLHQLTQLDGIKKDLLDFKNLIITMESVDPVQNLPNTCDVVELFKLMCDDAQNLNDLQELKDVSYFLCHNPVSWNCEQRKDFVYAFYNFRELNSANSPLKRSTFDSFISFRKPATNFSMGWGRMIPQNTIFYRLFQSLNHKGVYGTRVGLIPYHRACYLHYRKEQRNVTPPQPLTSIEMIDEELVRMFPDAIPKAWYELYSNKNGLNNHSALGITNFVEELKGQPGFLHYSKFP